MFDPYVWNSVDGSLYIARESFLAERQREQEKLTPSLTGMWSGALVIKAAALNLKRMKVKGEA